MQYYHEAASQLFNISIRLGETPDEWNVARVSPIPKSGKSSDPANYRPISLLSIVSKLLEKHVRGLLLHHLKFSPSALCLPSNGVLHRENRPLELFWLQLITGITYLTLDGDLYCFLRLQQLKLLTLFRTDVCHKS